MGNYALPKLNSLFITFAEHNFPHNSLPCHWPTKSRQGEGGGERKQTTITEETFAKLLRCRGETYNNTPMQKCKLRVLQ